MAGSQVSIKLENWQGEALKIKGRKAVGKSAFEIGLQIEAQWKALAAVKTGRYRGSITVQARGKGTAPTSGEVRGEDVISHEGGDDEVLVGTQLNYAPWIEYGTVNMPAQPAARPALALAQGQTLSIILKNSRLEFKEFLK